MEDFSKYTDDELDAYIAANSPQGGAEPADAAPAQSVAAGQSASPDFSKFSDEELDAYISANSQHVGNAGAPMRPEDFAGDDAMGGVEKVALEAQASGAPVAERADGSVSSWLKNLWAGVSHNTSGRVAEKNIEMNLQDILRGTVRKDGKDVPLTELPDSELDYLVDAAGWNGAGAWFKRFLGPWARSDEGVMQEWDRTDGARIADPAARKAARVRFAQERARDITLQNEREKQAARAELQGREKQAQAGLVGGLVQTGSYMIPFALPGAHGVMAGLIGGAERGQEMASDRYKMDADGNVRVAAQRDSTGAAVAKGVARGIVEPAIELVGGTLATKALGGIAGATLGKIPLVKSVGGKIAETAVGKALSRYGKNMRRFGKATGLQGMPEETIEELEDNIFDAVLGIDRRESEKEGNALQRGAEAAKDFFKPESLKNLAESMLLIQILGGGMAHVSDRIRSKPIDNILAESAGIDKGVLKDYTADEKWAAFDAYVNGLTEEQVKEKLGKGADAINDLVDTIAKGKREVDDFRDAALAMFDEGGTRQENPSAEEQMRTAGENRAADFMSADEAAAQQRAEEAQNATKAATEVPGTRGAEETGEETPEAANAPEGENGAEEEAETEAAVEPPVVDRPNRLRRNLAAVNFRHRGEAAEGVAEPPAPVQTEAETAEPADRPNRLRRNLGAVNFRHRGENGQIQAQPIQENPDEAWNGTAEAPAQPEQGAERPEAVEEPRQEQGAAQGAKAADAGVVEAPKAATAASALAEGYTTKPGAGKSVRVYGPDGKFVGSISGDGTTRYVGNRRLEADEAAPWEVMPEVEAAPASEPSVTETPASEPAAESPKPDNRLRPAKTAQAQTFIPNSEKSGGGQGATAPDATQPATQPAAAQSAQSSQQATQQTTQADATQPVVKAGRGRPKKDLVASGTESVRKIMDTARREDGSYDSDKFRYHNANGGLRLNELKPLYDSPDWHTKLGLDEKSAENLRDAVREAYEDAFIGSPNSKGHGAKRKGGYGGLLRHMANLKEKPDDTSQQALTYTAFADAMNKAIEQEDIAGAAILENHMMRLNMDFEAQPHEVQAKVAKAIRRLHNRLTPEERKNMIHFGERERVMESVAQDEEQAGEGTDGELDFSHSRANEEYEADADDSVFDNRTETQREAAEEAASKEAAKKARDANALKQMGKADSTTRGHYYRVEGERDGKLLVRQLDMRGNPTEDKPRLMPRETWQAIASADLDKDENPDLDPANPKKGDLIHLRLSVPSTETPAERAARFAADADYQKWLKQRKAKDAEPLRQRYELKVATWLASVAKRMLPGLKVSVKDRAFDPARDGGEGARRSIGGIFTGTAADYANRSRQGGVDDGPSLKKIGTGEGAQAYGWGLYGSKKRGVAESYASATSNKESRLEFDGKEWDEDAGDIGVNSIMNAYLNSVSDAFSSGYAVVGDFSSYLRADAKFYKRQIEESEKVGESDPDYVRLEEMKRAVAIIEDAAKDPERTLKRIAEVNPSRYVYEQTFFTDRAPGDESHLLKWYEPVSDENLARVAEQRKKEGLKEPLDLELWQGVSNPIGERFYNHIVRMTGSPKSASEFLARAGIDGVKYPVNSYGGKGVKDGDKVGWNYVSFRDDNIQVDHKWVDGQMRYLRDPGSGRVLGTFNRATGELTLFRGANWKTLDHELGGHATLRFAEQEAARGNRALLDRINAIIDSAPQALVDNVKSRYPGADEATLRDEIWAAIREGRESPVLKDFVKTLQGRQWYNRAWDAIKTAWKGLLARMGLNRADLSGIDRMTPEQFNEFLDRTMAEGRTLGLLETSDGAGGASELAPEATSVRTARAPAPAGSNIMDDVRTGTEKAREHFLDSHAPIKDVQDEIPGVKEEIRASDGYTDWTKSTDVAAALQKANGRVEHETRGLQRKVDTMARALNGARLDGQSSEELLQDLDLYAQCKHAKERNDTIARRNGVTPDDDYSYGMGEIVRNGARVGLSANVANDIIAELEAKYGRARFRHMKNAQRALVDINRDDIRRRLESGKLSPSEANYYLYQWSNYVPLKTDVEQLEPGLLNSSTAGPRRSEFMKAFGRGTADIADSPVAASLLQAEQGIRGSIRNETANVLANLVELAEAQGLHIGEIVEGIDEAHHGSDYVFTFSDADKVKANAGMQMADEREDIQLFKRDGKLYAIRVDKGVNGRGLDFMKSFKGNNVKSWGDLSFVPSITHWMSAMRTQYSPEFSVSNYLADSLEAAQALMGRYGVWDGAAAFAKAVAAEMRNAKDVWRYVRRGELRGDVKKAIKAGLLTKGGVASAGFEGKEQDVRLRLDKLRRSAESFWKMSAGDKAKWAWESGKDFIAAANEFMEYSTRIGLFSAIHNKGVPVNEAVKFAREATVDFNRKGSFMPIVNGLYMFANASVQGAARAVQAGKESVQDLPDDGSGWGRHKVRGDFIALLVGIGAAKAVIDHFGGNDDDRERKGGRNARNMSEYDKKHNVGIPVGGGRQMPLLRFRGPYAALPYLAQTATNVILGETKPEDALAALPRELTDQITDLVGGNGMINDKGELDWNLLGQSVAPSAIDPIIQLASGKDYKGDERVKRSFDENAPKSWNGKRNTPWPYKKLTQAVNALSGGNSLRKGKIDIAPEDAQLVWEFIWGGFGRDVGNAYSTVQNLYHAAKGGDTDRLLTDMPIVRRLVREYPESTSRYFDALDDYEKDKAEFKGTKDTGRRRELKRARPYLTAEKGRVDKLVDRIKELTHLERGEIKRGKSWVEPKMPIGEKQRERHRKERLRLQAQVLRILGE